MARLPSTVRPQQFLTLSLYARCSLCHCPVCDTRLPPEGQACSRGLYVSMSSFHFPLLRNSGIGPRPRDWCVCVYLGNKILWSQGRLPLGAWCRQPSPGDHCSLMHKGTPRAASSEHFSLSSEHPDMSVCTRVLGRRLARAFDTRKASRGHACQQERDRESCAQWPEHAAWGAVVIWRWSQNYPC